MTQKCDQCSRETDTYYTLKMDFFISEDKQPNQNEYPKKQTVCGPKCARIAAANIAYAYEAQPDADAKAKARAKDKG